MSWGGTILTRSRWRGLWRVQDGVIQPSIFNNGIEGMGMGICQYAVAAVLVSVVVVVRGGGGNKLAKMYNDDKEVDMKGKDNNKE